MPSITGRMAIHQDENVRASSLVRLGGNPAIGLPKLASQARKGHQVAAPRLREPTWRVASTHWQTFSFPLADVPECLSATGSAGA